LILINELEILNSYVFRHFREESAFNRVYLDDNGCVSWDIDPTIDSNQVWENKVDLCPDSCYIYGSKV